MHQPTLANAKKDDKRYMIEDAARTIREFGHIGKDPALIAAANKHIDQEQADASAAQELVRRLNGKTPDFQTRE